MKISLSMLTALASIIAITLLPLPARADTRDSEWINHFLILSTGKAQYRDSYAHAERALARGESAAYHCIANFFDPEIPREWQSIIRVGEVAGESACGYIIETLRGDWSDTKQVPMIYSLGKTGNRAAVPILRAYLERPDLRIRAAASAALGDIADPSSCDALVRMLSDSEAAVRRVAADSLERIFTRNPDFIPPTFVLERLDAGRADTDPWVRRNCVRAGTRGRRENAR